MYCSSLRLSQPPILLLHIARPDVLPQIETIRKKTHTHNGDFRTWIFTPDLVKLQSKNKNVHGCFPNKGNSITCSYHPLSNNVKKMQDHLSIVTSDHYFAPLNQNAWITRPNFPLYIYTGKIDIIWEKDITNPNP